MSRIFSNFIFLLLNIVEFIPMKMKSFYHPVLMAKYVLINLVIFLLPSCSSETNNQLPLLKISENNRYIQTENGDPFFWLGDTGWLLFSKLTREEAEKYLEDRRQKGFNVIQVMVLHSVKNAVNVYGDTAVIDSKIDKQYSTTSAVLSENIICTIVRVISKTIFKFLIFEETHTVTGEHHC